jgi:hypothetical protein
VPVELTVFTEVNEDTFDVLDSGKRRNAGRRAGDGGREVLDDAGRDG